MKQLYVNKIYVPADYASGELNLLTMERRIMVRDLRIMQSVKKASTKLNISSRTLCRKIIAHDIKKNEWKAKYRKQTPDEKIQIHYNRTKKPRNVRK